MEKKEGWNPQVPGLPMRWPADKVAWVVRCNMLKHSLQRREVENRPVFERILPPRRFLSSCDDREALFTESREATGKTMNPDADKTCSENFGQYVLFRWM